MKRDVTIPKFNLPGQTSWLMRGLWIAGGVVLLQVGIVGTLLVSHQRGGESPTVAVPVAEASPAPTAAPAPTELVPTVAQAVAAPKPPEPEPAAAPAEAAMNTAAPQANTAPASDSPDVNRHGRKDRAGPARFDRRGKLRGNGRVFARNAMGPRRMAGGGLTRGARPPRTHNAASSGKKPDEIDKLLRNFK